MTGTDPLSLLGIFGSSERDAVIAAAEQLSECLGPPGGTGWPVNLQLREPDFDGEWPPGTVTVVSLLPDVLRLNRPVAAVEAGWRRRLEAIGPEHASAVLLVNVYRHVADPGLRPALAERIGRLNLLAAELSREFGSGVVDVDRVFALFGAAELQSDFRLQGPIAAEVAGHAIVSCLFGLDLVGGVPVAVQEEARMRHGGLSEIGPTVRRRLQARGLWWPAVP